MACRKRLDTGPAIRRPLCQFYIHITRGLVTTTALVLAAAGTVRGGLRRVVDTTVTTCPSYRTLDRYIVGPFHLSSDIVAANWPNSTELVKGILEREKEKKSQKGVFFLAKPFHLSYNDRTARTGPRRGLRAVGSGKEPLSFSKLFGSIRRQGAYPCNLCREEDVSIGAWKSWPSSEG